MNHAAAAQHLRAARANGPGDMLPDALRPRSEADAYAIQRACMADLGPIGGWKVGAAGPEAPPSCAPMPLAGIFQAPVVLPSDGFTTRDIESEIAFILGQDLPPRAAAYGRTDVLSAIASCHPGIEILQSRFEDGDAVDALSNLADMIRHGAYVVGAAVAGWQAIDFAALEVAQAINGVVLHRRGNPAGDMVRLIMWLANNGARWAGGLHAGQVITCGSWTGKTSAPVGAQVAVTFAGIAPVRMAFS